MKKLPEYYIKAVELAASALKDNIGKTSRLPDINTPHNYLMRSRISARLDGGYLFSMICNREDGSFAGMGGINALTVEDLLARIRRAFNRQHKGSATNRAIQLIKQRIRK